MGNILSAITIETQREMPTKMNLMPRLQNAKIFLTTSWHTTNIPQTVCSRATTPICCLWPEREKSPTFCKILYVMPIGPVLKWCSNATNRESLLTREYAYHSLKDQQDHWSSANQAYTELEQVQADHARHRSYRSYVHSTFILAPLMDSSFPFSRKVLKEK